MDTILQTLHYGHHIIDILYYGHYDCMTLIMVILFGEIKCYMHTNFVQIYHIQVFSVFY